jgi:hypothetical protein
VRLRVCIWICILAFGAVGFAAQQGGEQYVGTWTGTWDGAGTGEFELTLEKPKDGALTGRVSVTGEPTYKATLKTVSFEGTKMTAKYDFPPDERAEVVVALTFDDKAAKGTWVVIEKASSGEVAKGTITVTRK